MKVDKPNKPLEISDSKKEVARAILDDRMEPFKAEIGAKLAGFGDHRQQLLRHMRDAYDLGPKVEPFDEVKSWFWIETTAYQYFARQIFKRTVSDREARYRVISKAALRARDTLEKAGLADHAGNELKSWLEGTKEFTEATEQYERLLYIEVEFGCIVDNAAESLTELEMAANQLADEFHKGPGRPKGTSVLPWNYLRALEEDYRMSTGLEPKMGVGPFSEFVEEFLTAIGRDDDKSPHYDYVVEARKYARKQARKNSGR
jgi:hypothetical protein